MIEDFLKSIWRDEYITKWHDYVTQTNTEALVQGIQLVEQAKKIWDKELEESTKKIAKELQLKKSFFHLALLQPTAIAEITIKECKSVDDFYNYLRWNFPYGFASLIDDCLYPNSTNPSEEELNLYLENRNVYIKNGNVGDKNIQLASYARIQQTLMNKSIDKLITTTNAVSEESGKIASNALEESKKSNNTARYALWIAIVAGVWGIAIWLLSYFWNKIWGKEQINGIMKIQSELENIGKDIGAYSGEYNQVNIENKLDEQINLLKNISSFSSKK